MSGAEKRPHADISAVYQVTLRDIDRYEENPRLVTLIPIGSTIGIAVHAHGTFPKDEEIVFVSASALGNALPALGYTGAIRPSQTITLVAPDDRRVA